jgi:hypothetical protein
MKLTTGLKISELTTTGSYLYEGLTDEPGSYLTDESGTILTKES